MATRPNASPTGTEQSTSPEVIQTLAKGARSLQAFWTKFNNDWVMNFAAGLAFNLITAILPILIAIIGIAGLTIGRLDPQAFKDLTNGLQHILPAQVSSGNFIDLALKSLGKNAGFLLIIAILLAIFGGSRLFVTYFLGGYSGVGGFVVILLLFFYYFAVILVLGAEINAFFPMGIGTMRDNLGDMGHKIAIQLPAHEVAPREQASASKNEELK